MKTFIIVILSLVLLGILGIGLTCVGLCGGLGYLFYSSTKELSDAGNQFLAKVGAGQFDEAYRSSSISFRQAETLESFTEKMRKHGLDGYQSANWNSFNFSDNEGTVSGTVSTKNGILSVTLTLVKEGDEWRVSRVEVKPGGIAADTNTPELPDAREQERIVKDSLRLFVQALREEDFASFYRQVSKAWQRQTTPQELNNAFQQFFPHKNEFQRWEDAAPTIQKPVQIDADGVLRLEGQMKAPTGTLRFEFKYVFEDQSWKLLGVRVQIDIPKADKREG